LKQASERAHRRSCSREFYTDGTAAEKARDAKYEATAGFENRKADDGGVVWPVDSLTVVRDNGGSSECLSLKPSREPCSKVAV